VETAAYCHLRMGRAWEALEIINTMLYYTPQNPKAHDIAGAAAEALGQLDLALKHYETILQYHPEWPGAKLHSARMKFLLNKYSSRCNSANSEKDGRRQQEVEYQSEYGREFRQSFSFSSGFGHDIINLRKEKAKSDEKEMQREAVRSEREERAKRQQAEVAMEVERQQRKAAEMQEKIQSMSIQYQTDVAKMISDPSIPQEEKTKRMLQMQKEFQERISALINEMTKKYNG
ncbi:MAG: hypothetical protein QW728_07170, partial [Thermoplasmata archaeon]